jgi:hypothetical protein
MECRSIVFGLIAVFVCLTPVLSPAATVNLPATGQQVCYDAAGAATSCAGTGQDGDLKMGVVWPSPRFVVGTGVESNCMADTLTGLMWAKGPGTTVRFWQDALNDGNVLSLCGYSDWRLPNVNELDSLVNAGQANMATWLNSQGFSSSGVSYWTSTTGAFYTMDAWRVGMIGGPVSDDRLKSDNRQYVWSVRGAASGPAPLWKTGQATCYDASGIPQSCTNTGQDGDPNKSFHGRALPGLPS